MHCGSSFCPAVKGQIIRSQRVAVGRLSRLEEPLLDLRRVFERLLPVVDPVVDAPSPVIGKKLISLFGWEGGDFGMTLVFRCA